MTTAAPAICKFAELGMCTDAVQEKKGDGRGGTPLYCANPEHTPLAFYREKARREKVAGPEQADAATPATAARQHAGTLVERFGEQAEYLVQTVLGVVEAIAEAGDPGEVQAELENAQRSIQQARLDAEQRTSEYQRRMDAMSKNMVRMSGQLDDSETAREQAIAELEQREADLREAGGVANELRDQLAARGLEVADLKTKIATACDEHAVELKKAADACNREIEEVRADAEKLVAAAKERENQAETALRTMQQAAEDAREEAQRLRADLAEARERHRAELESQRAYYDDELRRERERRERDVERLAAQHERDMDRVAGIRYALATGDSPAATRASNAPANSAPESASPDVPTPPEGWRSAPYPAGLSPKASLMVWWKGEWRSAAIVRRKMVRVQVDIVDEEKYKDVHWSRLAVPADTGFDGFQPAARS